MIVNQKTEGFILKSKEKIKETGGEMLIMEHERSGARLAFHKTNDKNKTFAIAFATPPKDSSGVFHIIEHSVLCGSKKYPIKEPFAELLKGSLNTFLNALTYEDRTVYPVSSRCEKDFYNLINIYLDAVFNPNLLENKNIFMQEGIRLEYDEESDRLSYNGVVYNEMKGVYSSPDDISGALLGAALFEGTPYGYDSGGEPRSIVKLTYEEFRAAHKKYYHPSNALICLDGDIDIEKTLSIINGYINVYGREKPYNNYFPAVSKDFRDIKTYYETPDEDEADRVRLSFGYVFSDFSQPDNTICAKMLCNYLAGYNDSPLKRALIDAGLCKDIYCYVNKSFQNSVIIEIKGAKEENICSIKKTINTIVEKIANDGVDKKELSASLDRIEFGMRERDLGSFPVGVSNALTIFGGWFYGINPADTLRYEDTLLSLREKIGSKYFEETLRKIFIDNPHRACVIMLPDKNAKKREEARVQEELGAMRAALTESELKKIKEENRAFIEWQISQESEEDIAKIPALSLSDISSELDGIETKAEQQEGARLIYQNLNTAGISYINLYFDASDFSPEELSLTSVLAMLYTNIRTENYSVSELRSEIKSTFGSFAVSTTVLRRRGNPMGALPVVSVSLSALDSKRETVPTLLKEILFDSSFDDITVVKKLMVQLRSLLEDNYVSSGEGIAIDRVSAASTQFGAAQEYMTGYESYLSLKKFILNYDQNPQVFAERLVDLRNRLFVKERAYISLAAELDNGLTRSILSLFPSGQAAPSECRILPIEKRKEALCVPGDVAFSAMGGASQKALSMLGTLRVVRSLLSYEYLWNNIRVSGGAYGTGFVTRRTGDMLFYSYRDPSPQASVRCYKEASKYLRELAQSGADITKFIIGAIGEYDILRTPRSLALQATVDYISGWTVEDERKMRRQMLSVGQNELILAADLIDEALQSHALAVVGNSTHINSFSDGFDKMLKL